MKGRDFIKKIIGIFLVVIIAAQFLMLTAGADIQITPFYTNVNSCSSTLTISGSTAKCESMASGYVGITKKIVIEQYLQKKSGSSWLTEESWTKTVDSFSGSASNSKSSISTGTYRLKTVFTINGDEVITVISTEKTK